MVDLAGRYQVSNAVSLHLRVPRRNDARPAAAKAWHLDRMEIPWEQFPDLRSDRVGGPLTFLQAIHRDDAARIDSKIQPLNLVRNRCIVLGGDECREIICDDCCGAFGEPVKHIVRLPSIPTQIKHVSDPQGLQPPGCIGDAFEHEGVDAIVGVGIVAIKTFVYQNRQI